MNNRGEMTSKASGMWCSISLKENCHGKAFQLKLNKEKYDKIKEKKKMPIEDLCYKLPKEFAKYLNYWRSLNFEDKPCISDLRKLFKNLLSKKGYEYDLKFEWLNKKPLKTIKYVEQEEEEPDYKKKLKAIFDH